MALIRFDQLRVSSTVANAALEGYTDGSIGESAVRVAVAGSSNLERAATGLQIAAAFAGDGLTGAGGSALAVGVQNGLGVGANAVGIDLIGANGAVTFSADAAWTFSNAVTAKGLFVTGTPLDGNQVPNKTYVDNLVQGLTWKDPVESLHLIGNVQVTGLVGNLTALAIEALSPTSGDAYVVTTANGAGALTSATVGDIWQYQGSTWTKIVTGATSFVQELYALLSETTALISPYTDGTDDGKRAYFDGSGLTGTLFSPTAADAYVVGEVATVTTLDNPDLNAGDLIEYSGTAWATLEAGAGGFVPAGKRAALGISPAIVLIAPYTEASDDGKVVAFSGSSNTGADTGDAVNTAALLVHDTGHIGVYDNDGFTFEGTVPTGTWIQFTGGGSINAGTGLTKAGNTINAVAGDTSITMNADEFHVNVSTGLEVNSGVRLAAQGNGIAGGAGSVLSVDPATEVATTRAAVYVGADGVGVNLDGTTLTHTTSTLSVLKVPNVLTAGNGITSTGTFDGSTARTFTALADPLGGTPSIEVVAAGIRIVAAGATSGLKGGGANGPLALDIVSLTALGSALQSTDIMVVGDDSEALDPTRKTTLGDITTFIASTINLANLSVSATGGLTGTSYDGQAAVSDWAVKPDITSTTTTEANAIVVGTNGVSIKVDNSTIEGSLAGSAGAETIRVKAQGIAASHLGSVVAASAGLAGGAGSTLSLSIPSLADQGVALVGADSIAVYDTSLSGHAEATLTQLAAYIATVASLPNSIVDGNGIADFTFNGSAGATVTVQADSTTGGNIQPANITANGVGLDVSAIAGTGIEADGSANLRLAAQGNGIAGGAGSTLSVDPATVVAGSRAAVYVGADGVGIDLDNSTLDHSSSILQIKALGVDTAQLAANAVTIAKLGINFNEEDIAASGFSAANPSVQTGTLANTALVDSNGYGYVECYRNGVADMTKEATGTSMGSTGATHFKIQAGGTKVEIGADISASGNTYRVRYLSAL